MDYNIDADYPDTAMASAQAAYMQPNQTGNVDPQTSGGPPAPGPKNISTRLDEELNQGKQFNSNVDYMVAVRSHARQSALEQGIDITTPQGQQWYGNVLQQARASAADYIRPIPTKGTALILKDGEIAYDPYTHAEIGRGKPKKAPEVEAHDIAIAKHTAANEIATMEANAALHVKDPSELPDEAAGAAWSKVYDRVQREHNPGAVAEENAQTRAARQTEREAIDALKDPKAKLKFKALNDELTGHNKRLIAAEKAAAAPGASPQAIKIVNGIKSEMAGVKSKLDSLLGNEVEKEPAPGEDVEEVSPRETPKIDPQDQRALDWLKANPTSKLAPKIKAKLQAKKLL